MSSKQHSAAEDALKALRKVDAATQVGVSYMQYGQMLIDAQAGANEATSQLPEGEMRNEIISAMGAYVDAKDAWGYSFLEHPTYGLKGYIPKTTNLGQKLAGKYSLKSSSTIGFKSDEVMPTLWQSARTHIDRASKLLGE